MMHGRNNGKKLMAVSGSGVKAAAQQWSYSSTDSSNLQNWQQRQQWGCAARAAAAAAAGVVSCRSDY
jgi:hypothetical protein